MQKHLIVGLGNPGEEYSGTRHNVGFDIVDFLAQKFEASFSIEKHGLIAGFKYKGHNIFLLKPNTFMNLSGKSVRYHLNEKNISLTNLLVASDDLHLPFGIIKCKRKGSDGGHNGHKDIIETINTSNYARLKFGIGNQFRRGFQSNYVLGPWRETEKKILPDLISKSSDVIINFCLLGIDDAMKKNN